MRRCAVLLVLLALVAPAFAQYSGEVISEVVRADYGWGNRWVDVTLRVQSFVRNGLLNFQVHPDFLGVDPRPGNTKFLRMQVRGPDGEMRALEYVDKQYVNLQVQPVIWGSQYRYGEMLADIVRADYGWGNRWVDVTLRVRSFMRDGALNFQVHPDFLGVDPRPGNDKLLRLQVREANGIVRVIQYHDKEYVALRVGAPPVSATPWGTLAWGRPANPRDGACFYRDSYSGESFCLQTGQSLALLPPGFNDQITAVQVFGNARVLAFSDPNFAGSQEIFYQSVNDLRYVESARWNDRISSVRVEPAGNWGIGGLRITRADYGIPGRVIDVTQRLNSYIRGDRLNVVISNEFLGGDPVRGIRKVLTVWYEYRGRPGRVRVYEGDALNLPGSGEYDYYQGGLQITRARYGVADRWIDVTNLLDSMVQGDRLSVRVSPETLGGDPARGIPKQLIVFYTYNGRRDRAVANEGEYLDLAPDARWR